MTETGKRKFGKGSWVLLPVALTVFLSSCVHTMEAVERLPFDFWLNLEDLGIGVLHDTWDNLWFVIELILPF